jgi:hypothetical protein
MINKLVTRIVGIFTIISVLLGMYVNLNFYWFTLFVGVNLLQSTFTNWCLLADILKKLYVKG